MKLMDMRHIPHNRGQSHANAKLSDDEVREIKRKLATGQTNASIAVEFHVAPSTISAIANGKMWRHI